MRTIVRKQLRCKRRSNRTEKFKMFIRRSLILILLSTIFQLVNTFWLTDCSYDEKHHHVSYMCGVGSGQHFNRRTREFLYCNNYLSGIDRSQVKILSFPGCKSETVSGDFQMKNFKSLRVLNMVNAGLKSLNEDVFNGNEHLEQLLLSNNILGKLHSNLFSHTLELRELNLSNNALSQLDVSLFANVNKLRSIDLSGNWIGELISPVFSNLKELEFLDISGNLIYSIDMDLLINNKKLKTLTLNNNMINSLDCKLLKGWSEESTNISINTMDVLDSSCINDKILTIKILPIDSFWLRSSGSKIIWTFNRQNFEKLRVLNVSGSKIENISGIIQQASMRLETLDLSYQFVGEIKASTFQRFINLKHLYLKQTNLTNFQFGTFYHQRKLEILDISYNHLKRIDFYLFLRNFKNLASLDLEGNDLKEIDSITRTHFPKLSILAISRNDFTCEYLATFLLQWNDLTLIDNPSRQTHMGGVDCNHDNSNDHDSITELNFNKKVNTEKYFEDKSDQSKNDLLKSHLENMSIIKTLLMVVVLILSMICIVFVVNKCKPVKQVIRRRLNSSSMQHDVVYNQQNDTNEVQQISLLDYN